MNKICPKCHGNRKIVGLGFMTTICDKCLGKGYIVVEEIKSESQPLSFPDPVTLRCGEPVITKDDPLLKIPKKPGRPKKNA